MVHGRLQMITQRFTMESLLGKLFILCVRNTLEPMY